MIGDYSKPTYVDETDKCNAETFQPIANKIKEFDDYLKKNGYIKKASNEIVNNSTTLQNDNDFVVTLDASSVYEIQIVLCLTSNASADFKWDWAVTGGVSQLTKRAILGTGTCTTIADANADFTTVDLNTPSNVQTDGIHEQALYERFLVQTSTTGTLQLRWAQNSAHASNTTVTTNSYMIIRKLVAYS